MADKNFGGTVMKMIQDKAGVVWVATYKDGLYSINPNTYEIRRYTTEKGLSSNNIYFIFINESFILT